MMTEGKGYQQEEQNLDYRRFKEYTRRRESTCRLFFQYSLKRTRRGDLKKINRKKSPKSKKMIQRNWPWEVWQAPVVAFPVHCLPGKQNPNLVLLWEDWRATNFDQSKPITGLPYSLPWTGLEMGYMMYIQVVKSAKILWGKLFSLYKKTSKKCYGLNFCAPHPTKHRLKP